MDDIRSLSWTTLTPKPRNLPITIIKTTAIKATCIKATCIKATLTNSISTNLSSIKSYVVLEDGYTANDELAKDIQSLVHARLSAHAYPRIVEFIDALPKTPSGKVQRFMLRSMSVVH